jgi:hypothetical protein
MPVGDQYALLALLNSLVANYLVRLQVTTHVTSALMARLPVPRPEDAAARKLSALARTLAARGVDHAAQAFARADAIAARLYALSRDHYAHVLDTFPLIERSLRTSCLREFDALQLRHTRHDA